MINNNENVIVIFANLLILYACIVIYTFKKYLWKPFHLKKEASKNTKAKKYNQLKKSVLKSG